MRGIVGLGRLRVALLGVLLGGGLSVFAVGSAAADGSPTCVTATGTTTCTFTYTGFEQPFTVPAGVTQATFDVLGAQGGDGQGPVGGRGGEATALVPVTAGTTLTVLVAGQGSMFDESSFGDGVFFPGGAGGFGGGASGGVAEFLGGAGAGGGGASTVSDGNTALVIAGGGGGATPWAGSFGPATGGSGGGLSGLAGTSPGADAGPGGAPGTQSAGGVGAGGGDSGGPGQGGAGADSFENVFHCVGGGGGGGGGYFGGAGGATCSGGGGGSGFVSPSAASSSFQTGVQTGDGVVTISYKVAYRFAGFLAPVDNLDANGNPVLNVVKAGRAIPLKWRLTDAGGAPLTTLASAQITAAGITCTGGVTTDQLEEVAAGASGLQNLGDGNYQLNWKSPTSYAGSCKRLRLDLGDGSSHTADFKFTK